LPFMARTAIPFRAGRFPRRILLCRFFLLIPPSRTSFHGSQRVGAVD
jgi:hypothetical protein